MLFSEPIESVKTHMYTLVSSVFKGGRLFKDWPNVDFRYLTLYSACVLSLLYSIWTASGFTLCKGLLATQFSKFLDPSLRTLELWPPHRSYCFLSTSIRKCMLGQSYMPNKLLEFALQLLVFTFFPLLSF